MLELIEVSPLGARRARRLRALADRATIDALVETHMAGIAEPPALARPSTPSTLVPRPTPEPRPAAPTPGPTSSPTGTGWMARGNCAYEAPSTFFPSDGVGVEAARRVCHGCPVQSVCLEFALTHRIDHGVWGGCSERERRRILKRRRIAALTQRPAAGA
jgi:WhiB family redox-sensing transcriptional regulator